tara:strand:- start:10377 stop:11462 length:1086 start_codon:yes stop_codon:yes gene_type:complete
MNKEQNSILVACGFKKNSIIAIKEIMENSPRMSSQTMVMSVVLGKGLRSKQVGHCIEETSCTIGLNWNKMVSRVGVSKNKGINPLYVLSKLPEPLLETMSNELLEHTQAAKFFYTWLMNESPYAHVFAVKDIEQVLKLGYFIVETKHDMRMVIEALMCTRYCWEGWCKNYCKLFKKLVEGGVNSNLAFQATYFLKENDNGAVVAEVSHGHSAPQNNMMYAPTLSRFVNKGKMKKLTDKTINNAIKKNWLHNNPFPQYEEEGYVPFPKRKTLRALGGFVSGCVSQGWGRCEEGFNVFKHIKQWVKDLNEECVSKGIFHEAYLKSMGTKHYVPEGKFDLLCLMLIELEFFLLEGQFPEQAKAA